MRGRKPKPTALKLLTGNPGKRRLNRQEPVLPELSASGGAAGAGDPVPLELVGDEVGSAEWRRLSPILRASRTVTDGDLGSLVAVCQQWSRYLEANTSVKSSGLVVRSQSGYPMPNPYLAIANKALGNCIKLWAELGLTPSARSRVSAAPEKPAESKASKFRLAKGGGR